MQTKSAAVLTGSGHDNINSLQARNTILLILVASVLATIPVWIAAFPPMVDLPEHASQVAMLRNLHDPSFSFAGLFWVNWFTPYLFGYMLMYPLVPLFGISVACKIVVSLALAGLPLGTAILMRETGADPYWALLTIPAMYGFSYTWGFLNFLVATPLGLIFLALVIRNTRKPTLRNSIAVAVFAILLFFGHGIICVFFCAIASAYTLAECRSVRTALLALAPIAAVSPIMLAWYMRTKADPLTRLAIQWDLGWFHSNEFLSMGGRITGFFPRLLGMQPAFICTAFGVLLFSLPLLAGARLAKRWVVWIPLTVCVIAVLFSPRTAFSAWAIHDRIAIFVLPFFLLCLQRSQVSRPVWRALPVFLLVGWIAMISIRTLQYNRETVGFQQILERMEPNQRALSLIFTSGTDSSPAPVFLHLPGWYTATKKGVVDINFALWPAALVRYRPESVPAAPIGFDWYPQSFDWTRMRGGDYRYFVVRSPDDLGPALFASAPCRVRLTAHSDGWWLFEKASLCPY